MGLIQDAIRKLKEKKQAKEVYENEQRTMEGYHKKKLSSNERDLMRYQEEERQKRIKAAVEKHRQRVSDEMWSGKTMNPVYAPNVITGQKNIFKGQENVFTKPTTMFDKKDLFFKKKGGKKK